MTGEAPRGLRHGLSALGLADWARSARLVAGAMVIGLAATSVVTAASPAELELTLGVQLEDEGTGSTSSAAPSHELVLLRARVELCGL